MAFADIANPTWTAGAIYYVNLLGALRQLDETRRPHMDIVLWPHMKAGRYDVYRELADEVLEVPPSPRAPFVTRQLRRAARRVGVNPRREPAVSQLLKAHDVDALFACWMEFGPTFETPVLGWIPDFQHKHHPSFFSDEENRDRDELFDRMAANCTRIVLSSHDARHDYERFIPAHAGKARVMRFVSQVPPGVYDEDPAQVCRQYELPERFFYLPNQFWAHKNHGLVLEALAMLKASHPDITVVCTGNPSDNRNSLYFGELLARVSRLGVRDSFVVLGWVPHAHTFHLLRQSLAVLQPSLFEGWSTTVEETKSIGKTIVVSDIPIHREQAPEQALYFDPADPTALAERLVEVSETTAPGPDDRLEASAREALPHRTREYAETFLDIVDEVRAGGFSKSA